DARTKEVEDRGRAKVIEEAVAAVVHDYAKKNNYLAGVDALDYSLLKKVKALVAGREVEVCSLHEWERAILEGYRVWRLVRDKRGGIVVGDQLTRTLEYRLDQQAPLVVTTSRIDDNLAGQQPHTAPAGIEGQEEQS